MRRTNVSALLKISGFFLCVLLVLIYLGIFTLKGQLPIFGDFLDNVASADTDLVSSEVTKPAFSAKFVKPEPQKKKIDRLYLTKDILLEPLEPKSPNWTSECWDYLVDTMGWESYCMIGCSGMVVQKEVTQFYPLAAPMRKPERLEAYRAVCTSNQSKPLNYPQRTEDHLIFIDDEPFDPKTLSEKNSVSVASTPCLLYIGKSRIPGADRSVFSRFALPKGLIFGPYKGTYRPEDTKESKQYAWHVHPINGAPGLYVDANDEQNSNWLRFSNCPRFLEEQTFAMLTVGHDIYYYLYKDVPAHTEMMIWYGSSYGQKLGIRYLTGGKKRSGFAAPEADTTCPSCKYELRARDGT